MEQIFKVRLFGDFQMVQGANNLDEDKIKSTMLTRLLVYIICHRNNNITIQELGETLWQEDETDNPAGALKNLMYRLRLCLKKEWIDMDFVITKRGSYMWNPDIVVEVDCEVFEKKWKQYQRTDARVEKESILLDMIEMYRGMLLPKMQSEHWLVTFSTYYHSLYLTAVKTAAVLLEEKMKYVKLAEISKAALHIDQTQEEIHCWFIKALIGLNEQKLAIEQYKKAKDLLYDSLGVQPSEELRRIYEEVLKEQHEEELDLSTIQQDLQSEDDGEKAFLCEYGVFKKTYQLEIRRAGRQGLNNFIALLTVHPIVELKKESQIYLDVINGSMNSLQEVLMLSLRTGDIISRYSNAQFIAMLPACEYQSAKGVMERIQDKFYEKCKKKVRLRYSVEEVTI